jgi:hypothetical protein
MGTDAGHRRRPRTWGGAGGEEQWLERAAARTGMVARWVGRPQSAGRHAPWRGWPSSLGAVAARAAAFGAVAAGAGRGAATFGAVAAG